MDPNFFADSVLGDLGPGVITLPLPAALNRPGRLVRDDAARGWWFVPRRIVDDAAARTKAGPIDNESEATP